MIRTVKQLTADTFAILLGACFIGDGVRGDSTVGIVVGLGLILLGIAPHGQPAARTKRRDW